MAPGGRSSPVASLAFGGSLCFVLGQRDAVEERLQLLPHLEVRDLLRWHVHLLARLRVAALPRRAVAEAEGPESADLHLLTALERGDDAAEGGLDDDACLDLCDVEALCHDADQVRLGHCGSGRLCHVARHSVRSPGRRGETPDSRPPNSPKSRKGRGIAAHPLRRWRRVSRRRAAAWAWRRSRRTSSRGPCRPSPRSRRAPFPPPPRSR